MTDEQAALANEISSNEFVERGSDGRFWFVEEIERDADNPYESAEDGPWRRVKTRHDAERDK
jgi:hypothetical protein